MFVLLKLLHCVSNIYIACERDISCKIGGFHGGDYEERRLLGRGAV
jgi:hypothetical protein